MAKFHWLYDMFPKEYSHKGLQNKIHIYTVQKAVNGKDSVYFCCSVNVV